MSADTFEKLFGRSYTLTRSIETGQQSIWYASFSSDMASRRGSGETAEMALYSLASSCRAAVQKDLDDYKRRCSETWERLRAIEDALEAGK